MPLKWLMLLCCAVLLAGCSSGDSTVAKTPQASTTSAAASSGANVSIAPRLSWPISATGAQPSLERWASMICQPT